ncbi:MAG: murein biosynthesis integral membrane protein MurJ [Desulfobacteraceae bacterium]|nr:MAG: murein biosynthesis integral membrane protein MurJ [Desulfobacteraceae bacterium]
MSPSVYRKVGLAALIMMISIFLSRMLGVLRESVLAALCGAGTAVDAYKTAFIVPEILNHITASGFFSITFIPIFARYLAENDERGGWRIFSIILTVFGALLSALVLAAAWMAPQLMALLAPGRTDPLFQSMAVRMTRILLPAQLCFFAGGIFMAVQFARERFLLPALAPLIYNLGIIAGGAALAARIGVEGFAWGALGGAIIGHLCVQLLGVRKLGLRFRPAFDWRHPDLRRYILLTLPLMFGLTMTFSTEIFSKFFGSFLPAGAITHIDFAWRIILMLVGFFGQAVGVAAYPFLARLASEQRWDEMNRLFNNTLRYLALVIPVSFLVFVLRHEIVRVLFERWEFSAGDTRSTSLALAGMVLGAVAFSAQTVVNRGFFAMQNTLLPAVYGSIAVVLSLPLYWVGLKTLGVLGIGLAISASALGQVLVLYAVWNRRSKNVGSRGVYRFYGKSVLVALPVTGVLIVTQKVLLQWISNVSFSGSVALIVLQSAIFVVLMAVAVRISRIEEARLLWQKLTARMPGLRRG